MIFFVLTWLINTEFKKYYLQHFSLANIATYGWRCDKHNGNLIFNPAWKLFVEHATCCTNSPHILIGKSRSDHRLLSRLLRSACQFFELFISCQSFILTHIFVPRLQIPLFFQFSVGWTQRATACGVQIFPVAASWPGNIRSKYFCHYS